jgi:cytochrome b involved in lipid metabolism
MNAPVSVVTNLCSPVQEQSQKRPLILIAGYIHDVSTFIEEHPGGRHLLVKHIGKDASTAFFGGVYDHSNAAHNVSPYLLSVTCCA